MTTYRHAKSWSGHVSSTFLTPVKHLKNPDQDTTL